MMTNYDVWRTCRTCLFKAEEFISLDGASDISTNSESELISNGDLLMELANVQVNINDGLPRNICNECAAALRAAYAYKQLCEQSDAKLRQIFHRHLNSVRVKVERIDASIDNEAVCPLEEHVFDYTAPDAIDECSQEDASEKDDDWKMPVQANEDSSTDGSTFNPTTVSNRITEANDRVKYETMTKIEIAEPDTNSEYDEMENGKCENARLVCKICNLTFSNSRTLKNHIEHHSHLDTKGVIKIDTDSTLEVDMEKTVQSGADENIIAERAQCIDGRFICEICNNSYGNIASLKLHIRVHLSNNLVQCPFCDRNFSRQSYLKTHVETQHAKAFSCDNCDNVFDSKRELRRHSFDAHRPPKPEKAFTCEICSRVFNRMNNLNQHRLTHSGEKNFSCDICQRKVSTKQVLRDHMRIHGNKSDYYRFLCPHCGQKFTTITHMHGHIRTKHTGDKPYKCESCELAFHRYDLLAQHKLKHVPRYVCTICGKSLSSNERLKTHSRVHSGEKPFKCEICDQAFAQAKTLKNHLRGHSGDVPNKCNMCGDVFTNPRLLELHRRQLDHPK